MSKYLIEFDEHSHRSLKQFIDLIESTEGIKLNELKVKDLTYCNEQIINPGHGIYIFKTDENILVVGKARTTSFTERIPKHFDIRPKAWFNRLLFITCREYFKVELTNENFLMSSRYVFENARLILINMKNAEKIDQLENILRGTTRTLNKYKKLKYDDNLILSNI
ncbi:hypothetical protein [Flavobacterium pectinovorum]|uniref:hypothetical protein n=1 Tax=Flavobacterium pectinovorum TaxID=29533 RepID=UPI001FABA221|nr:hypothetical protein [Flavobacterium pectinovorum]MCI9844562.1 hypothetical protein [Flavobacterium pectinovorum]